MTKSKIINIPQPDADFSALVGNFRQEVVDAVNEGHPGVILYFHKANQYPVEFIDELFRGLIRSKGGEWFLNSRIMVNADDDELKDEISDCVLEMLQEEMSQNGEAISHEQVITLENWQSLPIISGRPATEEDVVNEIAVFFLNPEYGTPQHINIPLPKCAIYKNEFGEKIRVVLVQAEELDDSKLVGMYTLEGQKIVGELGDVEMQEAEIFFDKL
jgi:hypothetical protein